MLFFMFLLLMESVEPGLIPRRRGRVNRVRLSPQAYLPRVWEGLQNTEAAVESPEKAQREPSQDPGT